ncbi:ABC transporter permease [bacterium]|nr:ABC transporter permease [bacterium]
MGETTSHVARLLRRLTDFREFMLLVIIIGACVGLALRSPVFLTVDNLLAVLLSVSIESIVAIGMTILLVSGGFDLSVGSAVALSGAAAAMALTAGWPVPLAVGTGLGVGALGGFCNGIVIAWLRINPFITTLAMMQILRGLLLAITKGKNISGLPDSFNMIGQGALWGIQYPIIIALVLILIGDVFLRYSRFFRQNYYIGGNERAAILSGIRVNRMKIFNYTLTGLLAGLAGVIMTARLGSATVTAGAYLELRVISAVIIGGASLAGGEGTVLGAFLGSLLMALIVNALTLLGIDIYWNTLVIGSTLLIAVLIDTLGKARQGQL